MMSLKLNNQYIFKVLFLVFAFSTTHFTQNSVKPMLKEYSFGKAMYVGDDKLDSWHDKYSKIGIINSKGRYTVSLKKFTQREFHNLLKSQELTSIYLITPKVPNEDEQEMLSGENVRIKPTLKIWYMRTNNFTVADVTFLQRVYFYDLRTKGLFWIHDSRFEKDVSFRGCKFNPIIDKILLTFDSDFWILNTTYKADFTFDLCHFNQYVQFEQLEIDGNASFINSTFNKKVLFSDIIFQGNSDFQSVEFKSNVEFRRISFSDTVRFSKTKFREGVDLRGCNFDSVTAIYLERMEYPIGKLLIDWDQIKQRDNPIIALDILSDFNTDNFRRLENIYQNLIHNYQAQGNKLSLDEVKYELEVRRQEYFGESIHWLYGKILGYGYKPLRFIIIVIIIIFLFASIFYFFEYPTVFYILNPDSKKQYPKIELTNKSWYKRKFFAKHKTGEEYNVPGLTVFWHCIFISSSLLLGLRFKKEWIRDQEKTFLTIASVEWVLGIGIYVFFALFIKTFRFEFLKGIFGL